MLPVHHVHGEWPPFSQHPITFSFTTLHSLLRRPPQFQYSPATLTAWIVYCTFVVVLMGVLKVINLNMHVMYDRAQILADPKAAATVGGASASAGSVSHKVVG